MNKPEYITVPTPINWSRLDLETDEIDNTDMPSSHWPSVNIPYDIYFKLASGELDYYWSCAHRGLSLSGDELKTHNQEMDRLFPAWKRDH